MPDSEYTRHEIRLRDVATANDGRCPDGLDECLVVSYNADFQRNKSYTEARSVSSRLPIEFMDLFGDGDTVAVSDLSADERERIEFASAEHSNRIDFEGTETGPGLPA